MLILKKDNIDQATDLLKKGRIIIFPTETSYGLGCDATNPFAVEKIFQIKNRDKSKPFLVLVGSVEEAKKYLVWNDALNKLAKKYWPGPLTIVGVSKNSQLAPGVLSDVGTVAIRVTNYPVAKKLVDALGAPLVATSANLSGAGNIYESKEAEDIFSGRAVRPDAILDFGKLPHRPPTTLASVVGEEIKILRQGSLKIRKGFGFSFLGNEFIKGLFLLTTFVLAVATIFYFWRITNIEIANVTFAESMTGEVIFSSEDKILAIEAKALYLTAYSAGSSKKMNEIINLLDKTELNSLVIDIKDYSGLVLYDTQVPLAKSLGLKDNRVGDLKELVKNLKDKGIYVIARQTVFQDPILAEKKTDLAIKSKSGGIWRDNKGLAWVDPTNKEVWKYNLAIAKEASGLGFDEINFDYMRFPSDGNMANVVYTVGNKKKYEVMREFFEFLSNGMENEPVLISIDMFGLVMEGKGEQDMNIGQRLADAVDNFDYVCPMMYPSHYPSGHLGFANPAEHPVEIFDNGIKKGLPAFEGKRAKLRPWIQAFNMGAIYDAQKIRGQIDTIEKYTDAGWLMWNAANRYTAAGLK